MNEIVAVFTYKRDELLYLCLEAIRKQDAQVEIFVFSDRNHVSEDLFQTCADFDAGISFVNFRNRFSFLFGFGNSSNVIKGMKFSLSVPCLYPRFVHCIEDDTIIRSGYFDWARVKLERGRYACALGRIPGDTASTWYESPCVCWQAEALCRCLELIPDGYLEATTREEMQLILDHCPHFKNSKFRYGSAEQDGFFLRCLEYFGWNTAYPPHSFASHIGWWGYNREGGTPPTGTFEERIEACRKVLHDRQRRIELFGQRITESEMEGMNA
jgi:hypothetical protein